MTVTVESSAPKRPHLIIIGSGFGGLFAARALSHADIDITLIARTSHHLFQPLLYQVATGILSPGEVAPSTREVLARQDNVQVLLGDVVDIDVEQRVITARTLTDEHRHSYDYLLVAAGAGQSYFGNDHFAKHAPGMKTIDDALELRGRVFGAFEVAELAAKEGNTADLDPLMTFVVIGAGPTGVEMAGQLVELSRRTLRRDFRHISTHNARIILVDAAPAVLSQFDESLQQHAKRTLEDIGVEVHLNAMVTDVDERGLVWQDRSTDEPQEVRVNAITKIWAAGVAASPLGKRLAEQVGLEVDRAGRVPVKDDLTLPGHPEVFVVGDMISMDNAPGVAQNAIQSARHATEQIEKSINGEPAGDPYVYSDKGNMATISRFHAIAEVGQLKLTGFVAWVAWLIVHLVYIIGFKSQVTTLISWAVSFVGRGRAERTITEQQVLARLAMQQVGDDIRRQLVDRSRGIQRGKKEQ